MEKLNKKTLSFPSQLFTKAVAALTIVLTLAACGNSGDGGSNYGGIVDCQNCSAVIANPIAITNFVSDGMAYPRISMQNMTLFGDVAFMRPNHSTPYNGYNGPVAVQGTLVLHDPLQCPGATVPAGSYALTTRAAGNMVNGSNLTVPEMIAGPLRIRMTYSGNLSSLNPVNGVIRWTGALEVISMDGYQCYGTALMM
ncbi:hypothetical protein D3C87_124770 [compost metagenome]